MIENLSKNRTILILFLEGFVSVSLQILMMRQMTPFFGSSVVVSSLVIGVFLAALALGYSYGGRRDKNQISKLLNNIIIASVLISLGLSYEFMNLIFGILNVYINKPIIEISIYLILFLAPIIFLLGQTVPLLTNFFKEKTASQIAGDSFALNTVGSVLGSVITSIVFLYYFGVSKTIFLNVFLLGVVCFLLLKKNDYIYHFFIYALVLAFCYFLNVHKEKNNFLLTNAYNNYQVGYNSDGRYLFMNGSYSSAILKGNKNWPYINKSKEILFDKNNLNLKNSSILILGAGGFTLTQGDNIPENNYTYVDIDPEIQDVVEKYFLNEDINGTFVAEDARVFVNKSKIKYDAILVDLYASKTSIPWHLLNTEFMIALKNTMNEDGTILFNIISNGLFKDEYSRTIYNTINNIFNYCHSMPYEINNTDKTNILYVCKNINEDIYKKSIYIDDIARSSIDELKNK